MKVEKNNQYQSMGILGERENVTDINNLKASTLCLNKKKIKTIKLGEP